MNDKLGHNGGPPMEDDTAPTTMPSPAEPAPGSVLEQRRYIVRMNEGSYYEVEVLAGSKVEAAKLALARFAVGSESVPEPTSKFPPTITQIKKATP